MTKQVKQPLGLIPLTPEPQKDTKYKINPITNKMALECLSGPTSAINLGWSPFGWVKEIPPTIKEWLLKTRITEPGATFYYKGYPALILNTYLSLSSGLYTQRDAAILIIFYVYEQRKADLCNMGLYFGDNPESSRSYSDFKPFVQTK